METQAKPEKAENTQENIETESVIVCSSFTDALHSIQASMPADLLLEYIDRFESSNPSDDPLYAVWSDVYEKSRNESRPVSANQPSHTRSDNEAKEAVSFLENEPILTANFPLHIEALKHFGQY